MARLFDDASSQFLEVDSGLGLNQPATLACWFRSDDTTITQALVALVDKDVSDQALILGANGAGAGDPVYAQAVGGTSALANSTTGYSANTWHHACAVFASTTDRRAFIDGGSKGTNATSKNATNIDRISIGRFGGAAPGTYTSGQIAEVAIWNAALTDAEVAVLGKGFSPLFVRPQSLLVYTPIRGNSSPERDRISDISFTVTGAVKAEHPRVFMPSRAESAHFAPGATSFTPPQGVMEMRGEIVASWYEPGESDPASAPFLLMSLLLED